MLGLRDGKGCLVWGLVSNLFPHFQHCSHPLTIYMHCSMQGHYTAAGDLDEREQEFSETGICGGEHSAHRRIMS